jgi:alpha-L-fucosidase
MISIAHSQTDAEIARYTAGKEKRLEWMKKARFGLFIHWGVYAGISDEWKGKRGNGESCFVMWHHEIPRAEYLEKVAKPFNPAVQSCPI